MATAAGQSTDPFYQAKRKTWEGFKRLVLTSLVIIALILIFMAVFLV